MTVSTEAEGAAVARGGGHAIGSPATRKVTLELRGEANRAIGKVVPRLTLGFLREREVAMTAGFSFFLIFNK